MRDHLLQIKMNFGGDMKGVPVLSECGETDHCDSCVFENSTSLIDRHILIGDVRWGRIAGRMRAAACRSH